ncbi:hypothetical protein [Paenibacillus thermotolerans]|uniref:hypothetical protein n=1 Tax=Paenibacillus thermotolerans TaxID=3027807 RepID=UPI002368B7F2|nr:MULTISPECIES: hypothetical protein [unclassified Paenibacillus]
MGKPTMALRIAWLIPNILTYVFFFGLSVFVIVHAEGLKDINRLGIWLVALILLLFVAIFGSYRIKARFVACRRYYIAKGTYVCIK